MKYSLILDQVLHISRIFAVELLWNCFGFVSVNNAPTDTFYISKLKKKKKKGGVSL